MRPNRARFGLRRGHFEYEDEYEYEKRGAGEMAGIIGETPFQPLTRLELRPRTRSYLTGLKVR